MSALGKGFHILGTVTAARDGLTFGDIVEKTELPKASAHRLLKEMVAISALTFDTVSRRYRGGLLLARLGASVTEDYDLRRIARPHLQAIHEATGHVTTLGILTDGTGTYLDKIEPDDFGIRLHSEVGKTFPLHCTAMGKVMLAYSDASTIRRVTGRKLESYTERTITDAKKLRSELQQIADNGYAIDNEEITRGLVCVAAPIFGLDGKIIGAMSCTCPSYRYEESGFDSEIRAVVQHSKAASGR